MHLLSQNYEWDKLHPFQRRSFRRFPQVTKFIGEIEKFEPLQSLNQGIKHGNIKLKNGTVLTDFDEVRNLQFYRASYPVQILYIQIILATGYIRANPFLLKALET